MGTITISRQLGSHGDRIANLLASRLEYQVVDKEAMLMEGQRRGLIDGDIGEDIGEGKPALLDRFDKKKSQAVEAMRVIMRETARKGNAVILGRGGHVELKDVKDVYRIRIIADFETRVARIMGDSGIDRAEAVQRLRKSDRERAEYVKHFFLADGSQPELYDLVINTRRISPDLATRLIIGFISE